MRTITAYPIKSLEGVTVGMAQYENNVEDFVEAGGRQMSEEGSRGYPPSLAWRLHDGEGDRSP